MARSLEWQNEEILITVRTYPEPSEKYMETSCVAGVTRDGQVRRLHPIPDRLLDERFRKYDILHLRTQKSSDPRPESHRVDLDRVAPPIARIETNGDWVERARWVEPFRAQSREEIAVDDTRTSRSLALIRPLRIDRFEIVRSAQDDWTPSQRAKLQKQSLFFRTPTTPLEFIPYRFLYRFTCDDPRCTGHKCSVLDWEVLQSYRKWSVKYGADWQHKMHKKYGEELPARDLQFFMGTLLKHPTTWLIVGLFYPPRRSSEVNNLQLPFSF